MPFLFNPCQPCCIPSGDDTIPFNSISGVSTCCNVMPSSFCMPLKVYDSGYYYNFNSLGRVNAGNTTLYPPEPLISTIGENINVPVYFYSGLPYYTNTGPSLTKTSINSWYGNALFDVRPTSTYLAFAIGALGSYSPARANCARDLHFRLRCTTGFTSCSGFEHYKVLNPAAEYAPSFVTNGGATTYRNVSGCSCNGDIYYSGTIPSTAPINPFGQNYLDAFVGNASNLSLIATATGNCPQTTVKCPITNDSLYVLNIIKSVDLGVLSPIAENHWSGNLYYGGLNHHVFQAKYNYNTPSGSWWLVKINNDQWRVQHDVSFIDGVLNCGFTDCTAFPSDCYPLDKVCCTGFPGTNYWSQSSCNAGTAIHLTNLPDLVNPTGGYFHASTGVPCNIRAGSRVPRFLNLTVQLLSGVTPITPHIATVKAQYNLFGSFMGFGWGFQFTSPTGTIILKPSYCKIPTIAWTETKIQDIQSIIANEDPLYYSISFKTSTQPTSSIPSGLYYTITFQE